jgi:endonuclease/exonuclease/phosphatase family metal-dependent hydrolase
MRVLATALLLVTLWIIASPARSTQSGQVKAGQDGAQAQAVAQTQTGPDTSQTPAQTVGRRRIVVELSDLLTHSPLVTCGSGEARSGDAPKRLRVASWNIRAAQSAPVEKLAAEMRAIEADVFALQEVDVRTRRGNFVDQPGELAAALGFQYVFAASIHWDEGHYGLAVVSRWPLIHVKRHRLDGTPEAEPRIVLEASVCAGGHPLRMFNLHADRRTESRALGLAHLKRIVQGEIGNGVLVIGDLNEYPDAPGVGSLIQAGLVDLSATSPNTVGVGRVDYLLVDERLARIASPARVWPTDKSDHHALLTDLEW